MSGFSFGAGSGTAGGFSFGAPAVTTASNQPASGTGLVFYQKHYFTTILVCVCN